MRKVAEIISGITYTDEFNLESKDAIDELMNNAMNDIDNSTSDIILNDYYEFFKRIRNKNNKLAEYFRIKGLSDEKLKRRVINLKINSYEFKLYIDDVMYEYVKNKFKHSKYPWNIIKVQFYCPIN